MFTWPDLVPWRRPFTIDTQWPPDVVAAELGKTISQPAWPFPVSSTPFTGTWHGESEAEIRVSGFATSFSEPIIRVSIEPSRRNGSRVHVRMRLRPRSLVVLSLVMTGLTCVTLALIAADRRAVSLILIPWVTWLLMVGGFRAPARQAERTLREVFANAPALPESVESGEAYR